MAALVFAGVLWTQVLCTPDNVCLDPSDVPDPPESVVDGPPPAPAVAEDSSCALPVCGDLGQRLYCIEGYESGHSGTAYNRRSGAEGWLQWLPSTARQWGVSVGNRWSEWHAAARVAAQGERFFRSQWVTLQLGLC